MRRMIVPMIAATLLFSGCAGSSQDGNGTSAAPGAGVDRSYDVTQIPKVDEIAALVPEKYASNGTLNVGVAIDYAPAEFRADDLQTAIGYDIDLAKALAQVLGLNYQTGDAEFASLMPGIGSKYAAGISSFTITPERMENYNMISYITVGSSYAVQKGNPKDFNPDDVCGKKIGVQTGTWQEEEIASFSDECVQKGKEAIDVLSYGVQSDVTTNLVGGKIDAMYSDSTVADYAVSLTSGQLEVVGSVRDSAPQGIVVAKDDPAMTEAIQKATQYLMDEGYWNKILENWGIENAALTTAELNPKVS